jgi:hypothetical protein
MTFEQIAVDSRKLSLYRPPEDAQDKGTLLFLALEPLATLPASIELAQTWGLGAPFPGYYLFLNTMPVKQALIAFNAAILERVPPKPENSGFAWVMTHNGSAAIQTLLETRLEDGGVLVKQPAKAQIPEPFNSLILLEGMPVVEAPDGFVLLYPPLPPLFRQPASLPPDGRGLHIPFAGPLRGCFVFRALYSTDDSAGNPVEKELYNVSVDPLAPTDPDRTYMSPAGLSFRLAETDGVFTISPA